MRLWDALACASLPWMICLASSGRVRECGLKGAISLVSFVIPLNFLFALFPLPTFVLLFSVSFFFKVSLLGLLKVERKFFQPHASSGRSTKDSLSSETQKFWTQLIAFSEFSRIDTPHSCLGVVSKSTNIVSPQSAHFVFPLVSTY